MAENWYYVQKGNRHGPVSQEVIQSMLSKQELKADDFVWKKGFENWMKIKDVSELQNAPAPTPAPPPKEVEVPKQPAAPAPEEKNFSLKDLEEEDRRVYIRIGNDRGGASVDYGPYSMKQLKQLFNENRINGKTFIFTTGMKDWKVLGDFPEYEEVFNELPPIIKDEDRRTSERKPFVARMFVQNNKKVFEGICRDISIGGMQVLMDQFQGQAGDKISINVHPENSDYNFVAAGVVVRVLEGRLGFSFRFQGLNDEARRAIDKYIQDN